MGDRTRERRLFWIGAAVLALALVLHLAVNVHLTVYSDDYWYGTFFRDGLGGFLRNTLRHYKQTNGRVWIHILIPVLLLAGTKIFAVISPFLTAGIFCLGLSVQDRKLGRGVLVLGSALGLLSVLGSEIQYLRMTLYWLSAFFNYAFPLLLALAVVWSMELEQEGRLPRWGFFAACLCALLAGSSTEQCGLVSMVFAWGFWLLRPRQERKAHKRVLILALLVSLAYLTILAAPGSHARMARGIDGGILSVLDPTVFLERFFDVMSYLCGYPYWNVLFAVFCVLTGLLWLAERDLPRPLLAGFPAGAAVLALAWAGWDKPLAILTVGYTLFAAVVLLTAPRLRVTGLLLLGAGASVMMLTITTLYYARTFFLCLLLTLAVCWSLLLRVLRRVPLPCAAAVCAVLAAVCIARYVPIYQGYAANDRTVQKNLEAIEAGRGTGEVTLSIDFDADYRFTMFFEGNYFRSNFLAYYGLPEDTVIHYTSALWDVSEVEVDGQTLRFPAVELDGQTHFPIDFVFQAGGGSALYYWTDHTFDLTWEGADYVLYEDGRLFLRTEDGVEELLDESCEAVTPFSYTLTLLYMSREDMERCFGITFDYDRSRDAYVLIR